MLSRYQEVDGSTLDRVGTSHLRSVIVSALAHRYRLMRMRGGAGLMGMNDADLHLHRPLAFSVTLYQPVWHDAHRLMHQFKTRFALANGFDRICPQVGWSVHRDEHIEALPLIDQSQVAFIGQVQPCTELPQSLTTRVIEEAIIGARRHTCEVPFESQMNLAIARCTFDQVSHEQAGGHLLPW